MNSGLRDKYLEQVIGNQENELGPSQIWTRNGIRATSKNPIRLKDIYITFIKVRFYWIYCSNSSVIKMLCI
jgi:hypothetical protein